MITWAIGHLLALADPDAYDPKYKFWRMNELPIIPDEFKLVSGSDSTKAQLQAVVKLIKSKEVKSVINACDSGREGELIFAYVFQHSKSKKPVERLWLSSMTKTAITDAFTKLRPGKDFENLEMAARARSEADWIVGLNATRAASIRLRPIFDSSVSLGRVQTPTLALIAKRTEEINNFVSEDYWTVEADFKADKGEYLARFGAWSSPTRFDKEEDAKAVVDLCSGKPGKISDLVSKHEEEKPPLLYDLTALQREANAKFKLSAQDTLAIAQSLYENHKLLTYPRTNSRYLTTDYVPEIKQAAKFVGANPDYTVAADYVENLVKLPNQMIDDSKVEDHHAIVPTTQPQYLTGLTGDEKKVYDLVARRFLAVFHPSAEWERTQIETEVEGKKFKTMGKVLLVEGWRAVYPKSKKADDEQELPKVALNEAVENQEIRSLAKKTQPPKYYNESSLLGAMETAGKDITDLEAREAMKDSGIGTPATRAAIIEKLLMSMYIIRKGRNLEATDKGLQTIDYLKGHQLTSAELTGTWEKRLTDISQGKDTRTAFIKDISKFITDTVTQIDDLKKVIVIPESSLPPSVGVCPVCKKPMYANSKAYSCWTRDDDGCGFVVWKNISGRDLDEATLQELLTVGKSSKKLDFKTKDGKPFTAEIKMSKRDNKWHMDLVRDVVTLGPCPVCKKPITESSKSYSCWAKEDHGCGFTIWKEKAGKEIPLEAVKELMTVGKTSLPVKGFKLHSGAKFDAKLKMTKDQAGKWDTAFNEPWVGIGGPTTY